MVITATGPARSVKLRYIADIPLWEVEKPYAIDQVDASNANGEITNIQFEECESECLYDLRGNEGKLDILKDSFEYVKHPTSLINLPEQEMMIPYAKEINDLLRKRFDTDRVITYDLRFRENRTYTKEEAMSKSRGVPSPSVSTVHADHTRDGGWDRISRTLIDEELTEYRSGKWRARIVNVWRSLLPVVEDNPFALLDPFSVVEEDLVETDRVSPISLGRMYNVKYNRDQKWYWLSKQTSDEVAIFVCFDSHPPNGILNFCPHSAFHDPESSPDAAKRRSVETRSIIFTLVDA